MKSLYRRVSSENEKPLPHLDGVVAEVHRDRTPKKVTLRFDLRGTETSYVLEMPGGHTDFNLEGRGETFRITDPSYPLTIGDLVRVFNDKGFDGVEHAVVTIEGMQKLNPDGMTPMPDTYVENNHLYQFREMPQG